MALRRGINGALTRRPTSASPGGPFILLSSRKKRFLILVGANVPLYSDYHMVEVQLQVELEGLAGGEVSLLNLPASTQNQHEQFRRQ